MVKSLSLAKRANGPARRVKYLSRVDKWVNLQSSRFSIEFDNSRRKAVQFRDFHFIVKSKFIIKPSTGRLML
jgi:hypothetical protein